MCPDEVMSEVWRNREAYAARHHHDLHEIVADLQRRQQKPFSRLVDRGRAMQGRRKPSDDVPPGRE